MDWYGNRSHVSWEYRRVTWPDFRETGEAYENVTDGEHELSYFTSIRESGSIVANGTRPKSPDLVRAYYRAVDQNGDPAPSEPVFTMLVENDARSLTPSDESSAVRLYGVLKVAADRSYGLPYTIAAGTNAVAKAREMAEGLGLMVNAQPSPYVTPAPHTFDPDDSYLTIINWLLSAAGYAGAYTDGYGTVQMQPYVEPTKREALWDFIEGERSMIAPHVTEETNVAEVPNVVRMYSETEGWSVWAAAYNDDPNHAASLANNGNRERTLTEQASGISASSAPAAVEELKRLAAKKLADNSASIRYGECEVLAYMPVHDGDPCLMRAGGLTLNGTVTNVKVTHDSRSPMTVKAREYISPTFSPRLEGGAL